MRALVIDLNNFSRYPTLSVGLITAILRNADMQVDVLSPLARGVEGYRRLPRETAWSPLKSRLEYWSAVSRLSIVRRLRRAAADLFNPGGAGDRDIIARYAIEMLERRPDVVLISAYTMYEGICRRVAAACSKRGIPVIVGGNYFVLPQIIERWLGIDGVSAIYGGEPEADIAEVIHDLATGGDVSQHRGVSVPGLPPAPPAPPFRDLDSLPFPDYSDFPWERYPNRIVPVMTGRGCGWGKCRFCSDVITSAGRTFRTRSLEGVLAELRHQHQRHGASLFVFLDLKLNSDLDLWRGLVERFPSTVAGAAWTASVHVDTRRDHGLSRQDLIAAKRAGLARITTGLESASGRLLRRMAKGSDPDRTAEFIHDAAECGIGVRLTAMFGYPGEEPDDIDHTTDYLRRHARWIERVALNQFQLKPGTDLDRRSSVRAGYLPDVTRGSLDIGKAAIEFTNRAHHSIAYRRAIYRLMDEVHRINRRELSGSARDFAGVM